MTESTSVKAVLASTPLKLTIAFSGDHVEEAGAYLTRKTAGPDPIFKFPSAKPGTKYIVVCVDLDAPFSSFPFLGPILHLLQYDLSVAEGSDPELKSDVIPLCRWAPPGPPPGAGPHRYVFLLYEQPDTFEPGAIFPGGHPKMTGRMKFDFEGLEKKAGLGSVVAGNWFQSN